MILISWNYKRIGVTYDVSFSDTGMYPILHKGIGDTLTPGGVIESSHELWRITWIRIGRG